MIVITGTLVSSDADADEVLALSLEHVRRSRTEPGCLQHGVSRDAEDPRRLVFLEKWVDLDAVRTHFGVEASRAFARRTAELSVEPPTLEIWEVTPTRP